MYLMIKKSMMIHQKIKVEVFINLLFEQGSDNTWAEEREKKMQREDYERTIEILSVKKWGREYFLR